MLPRFPSSDTLFGPNSTTLAPFLKQGMQFYPRSSTRTKMLITDSVFFFVLASTPKDWVKVQSIDSAGCWCNRKPCYRWALIPMHTTKCKVWAILSMGVWQVGHWYVSATTNDSRTHGFNLEWWNQRREKWWKIGTCIVKSCTYVEHFLEFEQV